MPRPPLLGASTLAALLLASPAWACAVCGQVNSANQGAYLDMTVVMSALPLAMLGGATWWLVRRVRAHALSEAQAPTALGPSAATAPSALTAPPSA